METQQTIKELYDDAKMYTATVAAAYAAAVEAAEHTLALAFDDDKAADAAYEAYFYLSECAYVAAEAYAAIFSRIRADNEAEKASE